MGKVTERRRRRRILAVALVAATVAGTGYAATTAAGKSQAEPVTLTISLFGDFGYHDLYKQYEKAHPGVTIKESIQDFAVHHSNLAKSVATERRRRRRRGDRGRLHRAVQGSAHSGS